MIHHNKIAIQTRNLWITCFDDSISFVDMYFRLRYTDQSNLYETHDGKIIAALQMIDYPMTCFGNTIPTTYLSGACTHPDFRRRGIMTRLIQRMLTRAWHNGAGLSVLIPAEPKLFDYYARLGYVPAFQCHRYTYHLQKIDKKAAAGSQFKQYRQFSPAVYDYLNVRLLRHPCCIQHTEADFKVIMEDLRVSNGRLFVLKEQTNAAIVALAVLYPDEAVPGGYRVDQLVADTPEYGNQLLAVSCRALNVDSLEVVAPASPDKPGTPMGMVRIIDVPSLLRQYAAYKPKLKLSLALSDPQLRVNDGYYTISNGHFKYTRQPLDATRFTPCTVAQLTERIFADQSAYMSLMLN